MCRNGVRVLPAPIVPAAARLGGWMENVRALFDLARRHFDWILVDLPPAAETGTAVLAAAVNRVIAVATPELPSLHVAAP